MKRKSIKSSNLKSVGFSTSTQVLEVEFLNGAVYHYKEVPAIKVLELILADSVGSYFAKNIKSTYQYAKGEYNV